MKKIILYGVGVEGELFYWYRKDYDIEFCVDRNCHRMFHRASVYGIEGVKDKLKSSFVIVAAVERNYEEIKKIIEDIGLQGFRDYTGTGLLGRKLAILYGNCHMDVLGRYLRNNLWFNKEYAMRIYHVYDECICLLEREMAYCELFISQDIRECNSFGAPSMEALAGKTTEKCKRVKIPNLYGYNLFWPQTGIWRI